MSWTVQGVSLSFAPTNCTAYVLPVLDLKNMSGGFGGYNSSDLVNDLLDVSGVGEAGGAKLRELDAETGVGRDVDVWWEGGRHCEDYGVTVSWLEVKVGRRGMDNRVTDLF